MSAKRLEQNTYTKVNDVLTFVQSEGTVKVPLIDVSNSESNPERLREVAAALKTCYASGEGFAMLEGTSIPEALVQDIFKTYRDFYTRAEEDKKSFASPRDDVGYKVISRNSDGSIIQEYMNHGLCVPDDITSGRKTDEYYTSEIGEAFFRNTTGPLSEEMNNRWPRYHGATPKLRRTIEAYYNEMEKLGETIWRAFALALDLPVEYFIEKQKRHISHLQVNNYPKQTVAPPEGVLRIKEHFDVNAFSILLNDEDGSEQGAMGRLQVLTRENKWKNLPLQPGAFIVNIGELLHRWTNGTWKHVVHRVTNPINAGKARITLGYFAFPDYDVPIIPLESCGPPIYEPTTCGEHSRTGRRFASKFYRSEMMDELRRAQGLYEESEQEVDAMKVKTQSRL